MQVILKQLTGQKLTSLHKTTGIGVREIFASEIRNPGLWNAEYSSRNPESKTGRLESRIHGQELRTQDRL